MPWDNYFLNRTLGVGPVSTTGGASGVTAVNYNSFTVTVNGNTTFPVGNTSTTPASTVGDVGARSGRWAVSRYNPPPPLVCSRSVALVFDLSASITAPLLARYKTAATQFVNALRGTATSVKIFTFGTTASVTSNSSTSFLPGITNNPADVSRLLGYINGLTLPTSSGQYTNWDAGIWQLVATGVHYSEALVLTDGDPTAMSSSGAPDAVSPARTRLRAVEAGIFAANALKARGTRIIAVGLYPTNAGTDNAGSIANLNAISGKDRGSDYYLIPFDSLEGVLESLALKDCAKLSIEKAGSPKVYDHVGQVITYTFTVTNTSPADGFTLSNITVHDDLLGVVSDCRERTLAPGESTTCTATHVITQDDLNAGNVLNSAHATGSTYNGNVVESGPDDEIVTADQEAGLKVTKVASPRTYDAPGQPITYTYVITNIGALTLDNVQLTDTRIPGPFTCAPIALGDALPAGSFTTCTAHYITTQADVDAGSIENAAAAVGTPPSRVPTVSPPDEEDVAAVVTEGIQITKTASPRTYHGLGARISYTYVATNTGNVTLHDVTVSDNRITGLTCTPPQGSSLAPGAVMHCTAVHVITQADLDAGHVANTATATGRPPAGGEVTDEADEEVTGSVVPQLHITKTAHPPLYTMHGQLITYTYHVTNTGNVTLRDVTVTDSRWGPIDCPRTTLVPGESMTCTFRHAISAEDLSDGSIFNSVAADGRDPDGGPVRSPVAHVTVFGRLFVPRPFIPVTG